MYNNLEEPIKLKLKILLFLEKVKELKRTFGIKKTKNKTSEKDKRRIIFLLAYEFLRTYDKQIPETMMLQAVATVFAEELELALENTKLRCDLTPEEERLRELPKSKVTGFDPLKPWWRDTFCPTAPGRFTSKVIEVILEEEEVTKNGRRKHGKRRMEAFGPKAIQSGPIGGLLQSK